MNVQEEPRLRIPEFSKLSGWSIANVRKKILRRELGYFKVGRIIVIPQSELNRVLGEYRPPIQDGQLP